MDGWTMADGRAGPLAYFHRTAVRSISSLPRTRFPTSHVYFLCLQLSINSDLDEREPGPDDRGEVAGGGGGGGLSATSQATGMGSVHNAQSSEELLINADEADVDEVDHLIQVSVCWQLCFTDTDSSNSTICRVECVELM